MESDDSTSVVEGVRPPDQSLSRKRRIWPLIVAPFVILGSIGIANYAIIQRPIASELRDDSRNSGFALNGHFQWYLNPNVLVLDLKSVTNAAPIDLFRGLFRSAAVFAKANRRFDQVVLTRKGEDVFRMKGEYFHELGSEVTAGQNPVYLIRMLPENLYRPSGELAFGKWTGGWLGVMGKQMEDVNQFGQEWADAK